MSPSSVSIAVRIRDMDRTRLFVHELTRLSDDMRVAASPHSERLERALGRYIGGGDDEGGDTDGVGEIVDTQVTEVVTVEPCPKCGYTEEQA